MSILKNGSFVISLDFEMMWGNQQWTPDGYGKTHVSNVQSVINNLVGLFAKYDIHATFATVGLIFCKNKQEALQWTPTRIPTFNKRYLSPYVNHYINGIKDKDTPLYFAPSIVRMLSNNQNIEIGSHTFSHYCCMEDGQNIEQFEADLTQMTQIATHYGIGTESLVFPHNQANKDYLSVCAEKGIKQYRGNAPKYFESQGSRLKSIRNRVLRLLDSYINIGGFMSWRYSELDTESNPMDIPASRFLRPYCKRLSFLEQFKLNRIRKEMRHAAKEGELYHLWFHPHNFGANQKENLWMLEEILKCYQSCNREYGMRSFTMKEMADILRSYSTETANKQVQPYAE